MEKSNCTKNDDEKKINVTPLSVEPYKGVRDFYPEDEFVEQYIFSIWKTAVERYGFEAYNASPLEPTALYEAKSGEEIVNDEMYTLIDKGERKVSLRPEMTPTVARMVAKKNRELTYPLRLYSIPNLFRYQKPQRGRLREHYQLNVDLFNAEGEEASIEIITLAHSILTSFNAAEEDFVIKLNDRRIINALFDTYNLPEEKRYLLSKILDKKEKMDAVHFEVAIEEILADKTKDFIILISESQNLIEFLGEDNPYIKETITLLKSLNERGITNVLFSPLLMRGFDYYTGMIFEVFDTHTDNPRALFGGGRYDNLLEIFDREKIPAIGFGVGDVTFRDFLETHSLLPEYSPKTHITLCIIDTSSISYAQALAQSLRKTGINTSVDFSLRKVSNQIKATAQKNIPFCACIGPDEVKSHVISIKNLKNGKEVALPETKIAQYIFDRL